MHDTKSHAKENNFSLKYMDNIINQLACKANK